MKKTIYILSTLALMLIVSRFIVRIVDATVQIDSDIGMLLLLLLLVNAVIVYIGCSSIGLPQKNKLAFRACHRVKKPLTQKLQYSSLHMLLYWSFFCEQESGDRLPRGQRRNATGNCISCFDAHIWIYSVAASFLMVFK